MNISNICRCLNNAVVDENVGIKLAFLTGNEKMSVFAIELAIEQSIPAHYHKQDIETYYILEGSGTVYKGNLENEKTNWNTEIIVNQGDCFTIYPNEVHRFKNTSNTKLRILGTAPLSHSLYDRYFVE
ncbi:MAG: cupin domain-containing protein [Flectobacillus sp.]|uniref:cupin domain-containing protein n=1 Tax=Flectobacillus sp. TaxID=50419 RepID=UPI003B9CB42F